LAYNGSNYPYNYYPYNYQYNYYPYQAPAPTVTYVSKYIPSLPDTGYAPVSQPAVALALAAFAVAGVLMTRYGRKTLAAFIR
jgi:hypothetical protein